MHVNLRELLRYVLADGVSMRELDEFAILVQEPGVFIDNRVNDRRLMAFNVIMNHVLYQLFLIV